MTVCLECGVEIMPNPDECVDEAAFSITAGNEVRRLTNCEWMLFEAMRARVGRVVTRQFLLQYIYEDRDEPNAKIIDVFLCHMRKKLKGTCFRIETVWGRGWVLQRNQDDSPKA